MRLWLEVLSSVVWRSDFVFIVAVEVAVLVKKPPSRDRRLVVAVTVTVAVKKPPGRGRG